MIVRISPVLCVLTLLTVAAAAPARLHALAEEECTAEDAERRNILFRSGSIVSATNEFAIEEVRAALAAKAEKILAADHGLSRAALSNARLVIVSLQNGQVHSAEAEEIRKERTAVLKSNAENNRNDEFLSYPFEEELPYEGSPDHLGVEETLAIVRSRSRNAWNADAVWRAADGDATPLPVLVARIDALLTRCERGNTDEASHNHSDVTFILVHDTNGKDRVGAACAAWRVFRGGKLLNAERQANAALVADTAKADAAWFLRRPTSLALLELYCVQLRLVEMTRGAKSGSCSFALAVRNASALLPLVRALRAKYHYDVRVEGDAVDDLSLHGYVPRAHARGALVAGADVRTLALRYAAAARDGGSSSSNEDPLCVTVWGDVFAESSGECNRQWRDVSKALFNIEDPPRLMKGVVGDST